MEQFIGRVVLSCAIETFSNLFIGKVVLSYAIETFSNLFIGKVVLSLSNEITFSEKVSILAGTVSLSRLITFLC